jgi:hypothetical protein
MNREHIEHFCERYRIEKYTINDDLSIDVDGSVDLSNSFITHLSVQFNKISGDFNIRHNFLTRLKGCPRIVGGVFDCSFNNLSDLKFGPYIVTGDYICHTNELINIDDAPINVKKFYCSRLDIPGTEYYFDPTKGISMTNYKEYIMQVNRSKKIKSILNSSY